MNKLEAIKLFKNIQNGRGTGDLRDIFLNEFNAGSMAKEFWDDGIFSLGVEYGILISLQQVFKLTIEDIYEQN